jgi:hypothetical protein
MGLAPGTLVTFNPTEGSSAVRIAVLIDFMVLNLNIKACSNESATTTSSGESVP